MFEQKSGHYPETDDWKGSLMEIRLDDPLAEKILLALQEAKASGTIIFKPDLIETCGLDSQDYNRRVRWLIELGLVRDVTDKVRPSSVNVVLYDLRLTLQGQDYCKRYMAETQRGN